MYPVSSNFKNYEAMPERTFETKALVGAVTYDKTSVIDFDIEDSIVPSEDFSIGNVIPSKLTITIKTTDTIATNAKISPAVRLYGILGWTEWVPLGSYYIDSRNYQNDVWKFVCYDKLILAQQAFVSALTYPVAMSSVMGEIVGQLGLTPDSSVVINPSYMIPYKDENITIKDMLGYIASAHGASVRITKDEKLAFVKFSPGAAETSILPSSYYKASQTNPLKTYSKIILTYNTDGETLESGTGDDDHTLKLYNPFVDQPMLDSVLAAVNGFSYTPFTMDWKGMPDLEIGDGVIITQRDGSTFSSRVLTNKASFKGGLKAVTTAPSYAAQRSEFDYKGSLSKQIAGAVKLDKPYYGVTIGRANGIKITRSDGISEAIFNSDLLQITKNGIPVFYVNSDGDLALAGAIVDDILHVGECKVPGDLTTCCHLNTNTDGFRFQAHVPGNYYNYEDAGGFSFYVGDVCYGQIFPNGTTSLLPCTVANGVSTPFAQLWVQPDVPAGAKDNDIWVDDDNYSRYDTLTISASTALAVSDNEIILASGTITVTLHAATQAGIIKRIFNVGSGIITISGTINGSANMLLYPNESVDLVTDSAGWRY